MNSQPSATRPDTAPPVTGDRVPATVHEFLRDVLCALDDEGILYCVERNYDGYPEVITGDVDLVVERRESTRSLDAVRRVATSLGWQCYIDHRTRLSSHVGYWADTSDTRFALVFEFFAGGTWRGVEYLRASRILRARERHGISWKPAPEHEAMITLVHHVLYNRRVYPKYQRRIRHLAMLRPESFRRELATVFGPVLGHELSDMVQAEEWTSIAVKAPALRRAVTLRSVLRQAPNLLADALSMALGSRTRPPGVVVILDGIESEAAGQLASRLVDLATEWHLFLPPFRVAVTAGAEDSEAALRRAHRRGGVGVCLNPNNVSLANGLPAEHITRVTACGKGLSVATGVDNDEVLPSRQDPAPEIWRRILAHRSRSLLHSSTS